MLRKMTVDDERRILEEMIRLEGLNQELKARVLALEDLVQGLSAAVRRIDRHLLLGLEKKG